LRWVPTDLARAIGPDGAAIAVDAPLGGTLRVINATAVASAAPALLARAVHSATGPVEPNLLQISNSIARGGPTDLDGHPRAQGAAPDLGAYETSPAPSGRGSGGGPSTAADRTAPTLGRLRLTHRRFRVGARGGTTVTTTTSEAGKVAFVVEKLKAGHRSRWIARRRARPARHGAGTRGARLPRTHRRPAPGPGPLPLRREGDRRRRQPLGSAQCALHRGGVRRTNIEGFRDFAGAVSGVPWLSPMTPDASPAFDDDRGVSAVRHLRVIGSDAAVPAAADPPLTERSVELWVLRSAMRRLLDGDGGVVVLDAAAGLGKTALLEHVAQAATDAGCAVRQAAPGPLERHFSFGVVRALLEAPLREASADRRAAMLEGVAAPAGALLLDGTVPLRDATMMFAHSALWLCSAMAEERPLVLIVDDAQWADRASLEVLAYLARRTDDLPLLIAIGARGDDPDAPSGLLRQLGGGGSTVLHPQRLTPRGAARLIQRVAPGTSVEVCRRCHASVAGNPWLLGELARQIAVHGPEAIDAAGDDAPPISAIARNVVRRRLAELAPSDRAVVEALAVIGEGAPPHVVAAVAGVEVDELSPALDALQAAGLLAPDGRRFAHELIAAAIGADLPPAARERLHRETARALIRAGAGTDTIASHLVQCPPHADPAVSELLQRAAAEAAQRGAPRTAAAYLERALCERAPGEDRGHMLAQLAMAAFDAGLPNSQGRLLEALDEAHDRASRIDVLTRLAMLSILDGGDPGLAHLFDRELAAEADPDARLAIEAAALDMLLMIPNRHQERARRVAAIDLFAIRDPVVQRVVIAHRALLAAEGGTPNAAASAALAGAALDGDHLLDEASRRGAYRFAVGALVMTDHADAAREAIARLREHAAARGSLRLRAAAAWHAAELALRCGRIADAENEARMVFSLVDSDVNMLTGGATGVLVCALAERGEFQEARDILHERGFDGSLGRMPWDAGIRHARARLWLTEGDFERAYTEACETGALREAEGCPNPAWSTWRSTAALALAHMGRREEAATLADAELALAERFGAPVPIARALHARAVAEADPAARIALCERALRVATGAPALLESIRARLELGGTLRYVGRRVEAREALRPALADADTVGAVLLAQRARRELVATGLRPRQAAVEGAAALTPRQRQVCDLAANGKGNRAIAQELFLSIKTVETHLAAGYRKLGVNTRAELAASLAR
jgi:DNA-binding CsgD family transcriptional regulator